MVYHWTKTTTEYVLRCIQDEDRKSTGIFNTTTNLCKRNSAIPPQNANDLRLNKATNNAMKRCLLYKNLQVFNELPNEVKNENNINVFKRKCIYYIRNIS